MSGPRHQPVLLSEVLHLLAPRAGGNYVDGTFGAGGYARAILEAADCRVWGIDRDPGAIARGAELARHFAGRLVLIEGRFGEMDRLLSDRGLADADGIALDLGVSSMQLDEAERGFLVPRRRAAGHAHGQRGRERCRYRQPGGGKRSGRHPVPLRRGAPGPRHRQGDREAPGDDPIQADWRAGGDRARRAGPAEQGRHRSGHAKLPGAAHRGQRRARRARPRAGGRRGDAEAGRTARRRLLPFARRPAGEVLHPPAHRSRARKLAPYLPATQRPAPSFRRCPGDEATPTAGEIAANPRSRSARLRGAERSADAPWGALEEAA